MPGGLARTHRRVLAVLALVLGVLAPASAHAAAPRSVRFSSPTSVWHTTVDGRKALDRDSRAIVRTLARQGRAHGYINTTAYSDPVVSVPRGQRLVTVRLPYTSSLQDAFERVPLPPGAAPARGTDGPLTLVQPSTDRMWEFWRLRHTSRGWTAAWGGAMQHMSANPGYYTPGSWPGLETTWWGTSASGLPLVDGLITMSELRSGRISHALGLSVPFPRAHAAAWPAHRCDGTARGPGTIPEGARFRLDPRLDLAALHLPAPTLAIARAAQRYGAIVMDRTFSSVSFAAEDPGPGRNPYAGRSGLFGGLAPWQVMQRFPWSRMQLLPMKLSRC